MFLDDDKGVLGGDRGRVYIIYESLYKIYEYDIKFVRFLLLFCVG